MATKSPFLNKGQVATNEQASHYDNDGSGLEVVLADARSIYRGRYFESTQGVMVSRVHPTRFKGSNESVYVALSK